MAMTKHLNGRILRGIGGFYYVEAADTVYTCRARGIMRQQGISPVAGDIAEITVGADGNEGVLERVLERRNVLVRPPVANVDVMVLVASVCNPAVNTRILDQMIAIAEKKGIAPILLINKSDLADPSPIEAIYRTAGLECYAVCAHRPETLEPLRARLNGMVSVFTGNSGVGKSSILNALSPELSLETGDVSRKLGRGRHTTRMATLYHLGDGYIVDTPGFSSLDMTAVETFTKDEIAGCFREFAPFEGKCRFLGCMHYREPDCAVRQAVADGIVPLSRYESYCAMYESVKDRKEWEKP